MECLPQILIEQKITCVEPCKDVALEARKKA